MSNPNVATGSVWRLHRGDREQIDDCYFRIRRALTMTFPDGSPVADFVLHVHDDGTAGWRWHEEPFDTAGP